MHNLEKKTVNMILIGGILLILGFILSLFMAIRLVEPDFILLFFSLSFSTAGLAIGGYALYTSILTRRPEREAETTAE